MPESDEERIARIRREVAYEQFTMPRDVAWLLKRLDRKERESPCLTR